MAIVSFLIQLFSGVTLLVFAVRFMRIGVEQLWSDGIRHGLGASASQLSLLAKGACLGLAMQGATVVVLMASGLAGSGVIPVLSAVLVSFGADLGSAFAVIVLTLPISNLGPLALLAGGWLYLNAKRPKWKNLGRVTLGFGLILLFLSLIREAVAPLQDVSSASNVIGYMNNDPVTAALERVRS